MFNINIEAHIKASGSHPATETEVKLSHLPTLLQGEDMAFKGTVLSRTCFFTTV